MASWQGWRNRFCAAVLLGVASTQAAFAVPVLSIQSTPVPAVAGSSVAVDVLITGVADLYSYQFSMAFDPTVLQATTLTEGAFLPSGGTTFFSGGTINNTTGSISFAFDTLTGLVPGVSGSGVLERIRFNVSKPGTSALNFSDLLFLDSSLSDITVQAQNSSVMAISAVPEPATLVLLGLGLTALTLRRRSLGA